MLTTSPLLMAWTAVRYSTFVKSMLFTFRTQSFTLFWINKYMIKYYCTDENPDLFTSTKHDFTKNITKLLPMKFWLLCINIIFLYSVFSNLPELAVSNASFCDISYHNGAVIWDGGSVSSASNGNTKIVIQFHLQSTIIDQCDWHTKSPYILLYIFNLHSSFSFAVLNHWINWQRQK